MRRIRFESGHSLWSRVRLAVRFFGRDLLLSDAVTLRVLPIARHLDRPESSLIVPPADLRMSGIEHYSQHAVGPQLAGSRLSRPRCRGVGTFDYGPAADGGFVLTSNCRSGMTALWPLG
jgi:hypothetical protein